MPKRKPKTWVIEAEIFSTGTWNGETFDRADLEQIAENFRRLRPVLTPPLKFGHDENQTLIGQADGDPALGWVEDLRVEGDKLIATFAGVPEVVHEAIREGRYRRVSAELYFDVRHEGQPLGKALKAVALLGADLPAVTNLEELNAYLAARGGAPPEGEARRFTLRVLAGRIIAPEPPDAESAGEGVEAELAELRAYKAEQEGRREEERRQRGEARFREARAEAATFCEEAVRQGRMAPHLRDRLLRELDGQARAFAEGGTLRISFDAFRAIVREAEPRLPRGEAALARSEEPAPEEGEEDPSLALARLAAARMVELNISYGEAAEYVLKTHPRLARVYRDYTLKANTGG